MPPAWTWDETLYAGSAPFYVNGRMPYPATLARSVAKTVGLRGTERLLDVGCGPGSFTLTLAPFVGDAVGIDADAEMITQAALAAQRAGAGNVRWRRMRGEELPGELGEVDLVTFAQSFHWMDRPRVAGLVRGMLSAGGALIHVGATTHRGVDGGVRTPFPHPPHEQIERLVKAYLGPRRRAGRSQLYGGPRSGEDAIYRAAGFSGGRRVNVACGQVLTRTVDDVVAATFSLSSSTPHLLGDERARFEAELRELLTAASDEGRFSERLGEMAFTVWRP